MDAAILPAPKASTSYELLISPRSLDRGIGIVMFAERAQSAQPGDDGLSA
jgi:hypothetical protein